MKTLKEYMLKSNKQDIYNFYKKINNKALDYEKVTRRDIYNYIISSYKSNPEIILELCNIEEINILKKLLDGNIKIQNNGYIDYILFKNLLNNFLIVCWDEYYIPEDLINCIKMAINLYDEKFYTAKDIVDNTIIGISRVYNVLLIDDALNILKKYTVNYSKENFKKYLKKSSKLCNKVKIVRYKNKEYFISLEYPFYKDVLNMQEDCSYAIYSLEEIISFGKYKINLFQENILYFLNFLEIHMNAYNIDYLIDSLIFYFGFNINDDNVLDNICNNIKELKNEVNIINKYFPIWIYKGNSLNMINN